MAGKSMGVKARHQDWRSDSTGSYEDLASYSTPVIYKMETSLCPQCGNVPTAPTAALGTSSAPDTRQVLLAESPHLQHLRSPDFFSAPQWLVWGPHGYSCSTWLTLLRGLEILNLDDAIWILLRTNWDNAHDQDLLLCWICIWLKGWKENG